MAKYLVLIYGAEPVWESMTPEENEAKGAAHAAFAAAAGARLRDGAELEPSTATVTLRAAERGRPAPTDGPFLETKEVLGGFYVLEADDLDEVITLAGQLPELAEAHGGVEIRPIR